MTSYCRVVLVFYCLRIPMDTLPSAPQPDFSLNNSISPRKWNIKFFKLIWTLFGIQVGLWASFFVIGPVVFLAMFAWQSTEGQPTTFEGWLVKLLLFLIVFLAPLSIILFISRLIRKNIFSIERDQKIQYFTTRQLLTELIIPLPVVLLFLLPTIPGYLFLLLIFLPIPNF